MSLESPFLDGELFVEADSVEPRGSLSNLESPFLQGFAKEFLNLASSEEEFYVEEEVLGTDERTRVTDTLRIPNRWICAIDILIENPKWGSSGEPRFISKSRGTGILIGPRYVLTARHVGDRLSTEIEGKTTLVDVKGFTVSPARNGDNSNSHFGKVKSTAIRASRPYQILQKKLIDKKIREIPITQHDDYALIILEKDVSSATHSKTNGKLGYWGHLPAEVVIRRLEPNDLNGKEVVVIGYPGDTCGKDKFSGSKSEKERKISNCWRRRSEEWASTQWRSTGTLQVEENSTTVFHTADTYEGQSGAPICLSADGRLNLVGIHIDKSDSQRNKGVRVTRRMLGEICSWMNADAGYQIATIKDDSLIVQPRQPRIKEAKENLELEALESLEEVEGEEWFETDESESFADAEERAGVSYGSGDEFGEEEKGPYEFEDELDEEDLGSEAEDDLPADEITEWDAEDADEYEIEDGRLFEAFAPEVSQADLRKRIDEYFDDANFEYTIPKHTLPDGTMVEESKVRARPQFHYARTLPGETKERRNERIKNAITKVRGILGSKFEKDHLGAIHNAAWGRPKPSDVAAITQGLINAGKLDDVRRANPGLTDDQLIRSLQRKFEVGIDCAGYVQLAFIHAFMGNDDDTRKVRLSLGLHERRGYEKLASLPSSHFKKVAVTDAQTGDLFVMKPRAGSSDRAWHTVIVVDHTVSGTVHTFLVDASWGTDLYGAAAGGVARRELKHDTSTGEWWDIHPLNGSEAHKNSTGPYNGHPIHGMYRAKQKK